MKVQMQEQTKFHTNEWRMCRKTDTRREKHSIR